MIRLLIIGIFLLNSFISQAMDKEEPNESKESITSSLQGIISSLTSDINTFFTNDVPTYISTQYTQWTKKPDVDDILADLRSNPNRQSVSFCNLLYLQS